MQKSKKLNALVVEDDYLVSEMVQGILQELGCFVVGAATTGVQAVELAESLEPDVIIMDIEMPEMDGLAAAEKIQQTCPTPIIILTAYETPELVEQASAAGVNAYLLKPPDRREMERAIAIAIARFQDMLALKQTNEQLRASNDELDAFAHTVAHDLQSPLGLIVGFSEMLHEHHDRYSAQKQKELLATVSRTAQRMSHIVDDLLLLASVRNMEAVLEPVNIAQTVAEARQRLSMMIADTNAVITEPDSWPQAMGYAPWIEEVWVNYLSNGLKYGGSPPHLKLGAYTQPDGMVRFWIQDKGAGLSAEEQSLLFVPFTRLSQVKTKGYGLGLSIVCRIVRRLDGEVGVESEKGAGSTFWFTLPQVTLTQAATPQAADAAV